MIPEGFKEKMHKLLGDEYPAFIEAIENGSAVRGLRVNLIKISAERFREISDLELRPIPYADNGYILDSDVRIGATPEHHSGMIYMQDPGAMASVNALDIQPDWFVADLCAAPGGKSSQVAERLGKNGFLLSNEYVPKRAKITVSNFERLGVRNAIVTSLDTAELADMYHSVFDLVICDAPCSGEGMFRKGEEAEEAWSQENVLACAKRQREILENAERMVRSGGYLLYSTCTYSPEENEETVAYFLKRHTDFHLVPVKQKMAECTRDGVVPEGCEGLSLNLTRRFYPHITEGEGQFIALMKRDVSPYSPRSFSNEKVQKLSKSEERIIDGFFRDSLTERPDGRLIKSGDSIVLIPHAMPLPPKSVFMSGVMLGEIRGKLLCPAHQFFSVYGELFKSRIDLGKGDPRVSEYLRGCEIESTDPDVKGWCAVAYEGVPLGGGKASAGRVKNHYPKGLRNK